MSTSNRHFLSLLPLFAVLSISPMELSTKALSRGIAAENPTPAIVKLKLPEAPKLPEKLAPLALPDKDSAVERIEPIVIQAAAQQKVGEVIAQLEYRVVKLKTEEAKLPETLETLKIGNEIKLLETRVVKLQLQESKLPEILPNKPSQQSKVNGEAIDKLEARIALLKIEQQKLPETLIPTEKEKKIDEGIALLEFRLVKLKLEESKIPEPNLLKLEAAAEETSEVAQELESRIAKLKLESDKGVPAQLAKLPDVQVKATEVCDLEEKNKVLTKQVDELMGQQKSIIESLFNMNAMMAQYIRGQQQPQQPVNQPLSYQQIYPTLSSASAGSWVFFPQGSQALPQQQPQLAQPQVQYGQPQYPQQQPIVQQQPYSTFGQPQIYSPVPSQYDARYNQPQSVTPANFGSSPFTYNFGSNNTFNWMS